MTLSVFLGLAVGYKCFWGIYTQLSKIWEGDLKEHPPSPGKKKKENETTPREKMNVVRVYDELGK